MLSSTRVFDALLHQSRGPLEVVASPRHLAQVGERTGCCSAIRQGTRMYEAFCEGRIRACEIFQLKIGEADVVESGRDAIEIIERAFER